MASSIGTVSAALAAPPVVDLLGHTPWLWIGLIILMLLQMAFILGLQRSRLRFRKAKKALDESHHLLEQRVEERTERLTRINDELHWEVQHREATELQLLEIQAFNDAILNALPTLLVGVDQSLCVTHWNQAAETTTGVTADQALGKPLVLLHSYFWDLEPMVRETLNGQKMRSLERVKVARDEDAPLYFDIAAYPFHLDQHPGVVLRMEDVTLKVRFENTLVQSEKMLSMGELAAGLAHEINNPMASILQGVQNVQRRLDPKLPKNRDAAQSVGLDFQQLQGYLDKRHIPTLLTGIRETGERASMVVSNMLEFARPPKRHSDPIPIHQVLRHTLELVEASIHQYSYLNRYLDIVTDFQAESDVVKGNASELQQVFLNLIRNALQAMDRPEQAPLARLSVETRHYNNHLQVIIEDNGPGMNERVLHHLFEPFFTTKEVGVGTGLGLSVSYFIISKHHGGQIDVDSRPGRGSRFIVTLNAWDASSETQPNPAV